MPIFENCKKLKSLHPTPQPWDWQTIVNLSFTDILQDADPMDVLLHPPDACHAGACEGTAEQQQQPQHLQHPDSPTRSRTTSQGWEFAHRFSEWITRFLRKKEQLSYSLKKLSNLLKKLSDSLICSFLVIHLSDSLMVAHFWWATWAISSNCSFLVSDLSNLFNCLTKKEGISELLIF